MISSCRFICDCVGKLKKKGYTVFGLQFYGECWSGPKVGCSYQKFGKTYKCVNQNKMQCSDDTTMLCSGDSARTTYVYVPDDTPVTCPTKIPTQPNVTPKITPRVTPRITLKTTLKIVTAPKPTPKVTIPKGPPVIKCGNIEYKLTKLGCWNELGDTRPPRAMPELLFTSRDRNSHAYVGYDFNRHNYGPFLERYVEYYMTYILLTKANHINVDEKYLLHLMVISPDHEQV